MKSSFINKWDTIEKPAFISPWTLSHFVIGVATYSLLVKTPLNVPVILSAAILFILHMIYEIKDFYEAYVLKVKDPNKQNSLLNSLGDQVFAMLGFWIAHLVSFKPHYIPVLFFLLFVILSIPQIGNNNKAVFTLSELWNTRG